MLFELAIRLAAAIDQLKGPAMFTLKECQSPTGGEREQPVTAAFRLQFLLDHGLQLYMSTINSSQSGAKLKSRRTSARKTLTTALPLHPLKRLISNDPSNLQLSAIVEGRS
jgi:hypothetical protein